MKTTLSRILTATLAVALALLCICSLAACGKKTSAGIPAPTPLPNNAQDKPATITTYVKENQAVLEETVKMIMNSKGLSYYYFVRNTEDTVLVQEMVNKGGNLSRKTIDNKTLNTLAATGFVGEITHNAETTKGIVSFYTYLSNSRGTHLFAYCPTAEAREFLHNGFFQGDGIVTTTPIVGNWFYISVK